MWYLPLESVPVNSRYEIQRMKNMKKELSNIKTKELAKTLDVAKSTVLDGKQLWWMTKQLFSW